MLNSSTAFQNTVVKQTISEAQQLSDEITAAELTIQRATTRGLFVTLFNSRLIGNPAVELSNHDGLTLPQLDFLTTLTEAGYTVERDSSTGWWKISWASSGPEQSVRVYTVRTIVSPGAVSAQTIAVINNYFATHYPTATSRTSLFSPPDSGGNVDETLFGATASTFYEYVVVAHQQDASDYSSGIKSTLTSSGLGYNSSNVAVWKTA